MDGGHNKGEIALEPDSYRLCQKNNAVRLGPPLFCKLRR